MVIRSCYFQPETLRQKSIAMRRQCAELHHLNPARFTPPRAALLLLDLQDYFLNSNSHAFLPAAPAILPGLIRLAEWCKRQGIPVYLTRHTNTSENAGQMSTWWRDILTADKPASRLDAHLLLSAAQVIEKTQYDAFYLTGLDRLLKQANVSQLVIGGVMTHLCCETTARAAFTRGYEVLFLVDGTATYNESYHQASLLNLSQGFASLVLVEELIARQDLRIGEAEHA